MRICCRWRGRMRCCLLQRDPKLETPRGQAVKVLLNLFEQREAIETVRAG